MGPVEVVMFFHSNYFKPLFPRDFPVPWLINYRRENHPIIYTCWAGYDLVRGCRWPRVLDSCRGSVGLAVASWRRMTALKICKHLKYPKTVTFMYTFDYFGHFLHKTLFSEDWWTSQAHTTWGYVDWMFTTPLMLIELGILAGAPPTQTITLIVAGRNMLKSTRNGGFNGKIIYKWAIFHGYVK